jgi:hypothetical protein
MLLSYDTIAIHYKGAVFGPCVDSVLSVMVSGLEEELSARIKGTKVTSSSRNLAASGINES